MDYESMILVFKHEQAICKKLKREHFDAWSEAIDKGDKVGASVEEEMIASWTGQILAWGQAIEAVERFRDGVLTMTDKYAIMEA